MELHFRSDPDASVQWLYSSLYGCGPDIKWSGGESCDVASIASESRQTIAGGYDDNIVVIENFPEGLPAKTKSVNAVLSPSIRAGPSSLKVVVSSSARTVAWLEGARIVRFEQVDEASLAQGATVDDQHFIAADAQFSIADYALSGDGSILATLQKGVGDEFVQTFNTPAGGRRTGFYTRFAHADRLLDVSESGQFIALHCSDNRLLVWEPDRFFGIVFHGSSAKYARFSPVARELATIQLDGKSIYVREIGPNVQSPSISDYGTAELLPVRLKIAMRSPAIGFAYSSDGRLIAIATEQYVSIFDLEAKRSLGRLSLSHRPTALACFKLDAQNYRLPIGFDKGVTFERFQLH